jgi:hypothetical protein
MMMFRTLAVKVLNIKWCKGVVQRIGSAPRFAPLEDGKQAN